MQAFRVTHLKKIKTNRSFCLFSRSIGRHDFFLVNHLGRLGSSSSSPMSGWKSKLLLEGHQIEGHQLLQLSHLSSLSLSFKSRKRSWFSWRRRRSISCSTGFYHCKSAVLVRKLAISSWSFSSSSTIFSRDLCRVFPWDIQKPDVFRFR